jgi:hypothetical protein
MHHIFNNFANPEFGDELTSVVSVAWLWYTSCTVSSVAATMHHEQQKKHLMQGIQQMGQHNEGGIFAFLGLSWWTRWTEKLRALIEVSRSVNSSLFLQHSNGQFI